MHIVSALPWVADVLFVIYYWRLTTKTRNTLLWAFGGQVLYIVWALVIVPHVWAVAVVDVMCAAFSIRAYQRWL